MSDSGWGYPRSEWRCELFGMGKGLVFIPEKGCEPNWFWRWMQYLILGNKWIKEENAQSS